MGDFCSPLTSSSQYLQHPHHPPILIHHRTSYLSSSPHSIIYIPYLHSCICSAPATSSSPILPTHPSPSPHQPDMSKHTQGQASTHDLLQQMLNPLVSNDDATPPLEGLFPDTISKMPHMDEEEEAKQPPPPPPPKEWTENVYTFQDLQTQVNLCNSTGEMQKQGLRMIDIMDVRTLTHFIRKSMWCWADDHP